MDALTPVDQRKDTDKKNTLNNACDTFMKALLQTGTSMEEAEGLSLEGLVDKLETLKITRLMLLRVTGRGEAILIGGQNDTPMNTLST